MSTTSTRSLETRSDAQLNELFAIEVAGWRSLVGSTNEGWLGIPPASRGYAEAVPNWCGDPQKVLLWLGKDWDVRTRNGVVRVTVYRPSEESEGEATDYNFARACVIAVIRAKRAEKGSQ